MIHQLWLIGIGTGSPSHVTLEGRQALRDAAVILLPRKGDAKGDLAHIRQRLIDASGSSAAVVPFDYPLRDPDLPYLDRVDRWHDDIARRWQVALADHAVAGPVALLVWGDPALYDSTIRIAGRLDPVPQLRVVPGITAIQALTAAHAIPLNTVNGPVLITTGRRLRDEGWPTGAETVAVMLDGEASFASIDVPGLQIWWGAFLGMEEQILDHGPLFEAAPRIVKARAEARERHGWLMDTYLLRHTDA